MKHLLKPFALGSLGVALLGLILGLQPLLIAIGLVSWLGSIAYYSIKESGKSRHDSTLSTEGRALIRPLKDLRAQIEKIVEAFNDKPEIKVIGGEALIEADGLIEHTNKLVEIHDEIIRTLKGKNEAEHEIKEIDKKVANAEKGPIKDALISSAAARRSEIERYKQIEETRIRIVAKVKLAETALFEIKAKLSAGAVGAEPDDLEQDELAGMVSRLKSLSASFDEAEEMVKDRIS